MELKRNLETKQIFLVDNENILLQTGKIGAEFIIYLYTDTEITITKELDEYLYMNLKQILENEYIFHESNLSYKKNDTIIWFSEQYCDIEDKEQTDRVNRLIIKNIDNQIKISFENPYCKKYSIKRKQNIIVFSPCGNGLYSKNINTGLTFQDDIVYAFYKTLIYQYDNNGKALNKKRKR